MDATPNAETTGVPGPGAASVSESRDYPTWESWRKGLSEKKKTAVRARFTLLKAKRFTVYAAQTPVWRQVAVLVLTPVPSLLVSLLAPLIPLQDPTLGALQNGGFCLHLLVTITLTVFGAMVQARAAVGLTHAEYTTFDIAAVAFLSALHLLGALTFLGYAWWFPVPFSWVVSFAPWMMCLVWGHVIVLRGRLRSPYLRNRLVFYLPSLAAQVSQVVVYPVYSAAFEAAGQYGQFVLVAIFPLLKRGLKSQILLMSHHLGDYAREVAVCSVEISASMYQAMIMQNSPTLASTVLIIGLDVAQGILEIRQFLRHNSVVPNEAIVPTALDLIQDSTKTFQEQDLTKCGSHPNSLIKKLTIKRFSVRGRVQVVPSKNESLPASKETQVVTHALEILQSAETILLVEYLEVAVPIANTVFLFVAAHLPSAVFNPKLHPFYNDKAALYKAIVSILTYMILQAATLLVMEIVIRVRYRVSALVLLGFALESQAWSMQGKMIAWLPVILAFSVVHYGVDFTFKFDFANLPISG